ncbi:WxL domain-containing protein [Enterococcus malodoratus]|uniref:Uncharacterized protein n=1 Tax=Enterococcus malodoratus ATCC 43197 TaxID=1158601 RepID=R2QW84_9ENTE|nr:WxL domain-containing protein [Enterococcus malodoratus]EOH75730.1 hypothetical protein UAI_02739 [Enterococcus malodoratus ATCC 43197]EOT67557.1 hypothetical protein I585_03078 [Enterococcus malodoratus ATCC 43197]OJG64584.1 hypothetical protein RV07_GL003960 [Enterococcus malodoratus]SPX03421.1 Uncharacterised protein [Enterococcus malodoratus]STD69191.1 Uncharacterised protein [Enterococcus malodoratus]
MKDLKGKLLLCIASLSILGMAFAGSIGGFADTLDTPVRVQFEADGHVPNPNPDPDELQLRFVPNLVDFGNAHTAGNAVTQSIGTSGKYVALYDGRDSNESNNEWTLSASASSLTNPVAPAQVINSGKIKVAVGTMKDWTAPSEPTAATATADAADITVGSGVTAGVAELSLDGTSAELAKTDASISDHGYALPIDSMTLELAAGDSNTNFAGQTFHGNITWALTDSF